MKKANEEGKDMEYCTTMCGEPIWMFPMRVIYSHEQKVKTELDSFGIENFILMT